MNPYRATCPTPGRPSGDPCWDDSGVIYLVWLAVGGVRLAPALARGSIRSVEVALAAAICGLSAIGLAAWGCKRVLARR